MSNDFLPENYEAPKSNGGQYYKFQQGDNKFRILSQPIIGWIDWSADNKPIRTPHKEPKPSPINPAKPIKHFWAFVVWVYDKSELQILEITQQGIQTQIQTLVRDPDWGAPYDYDICVTKTGQDKETKYTVNPKPHKPLLPEIEAAILATPIVLEKLFTNEDPFQK